MRYMCIRDCIHEGAYRYSGDVYSFSSAPSGDAANYFEAFSGDVRTRSGLDVHVDLDRTYYFGREWWDDLRFPFVGLRLETAGGKLQYNLAEKGVDFASDASTSDGDSIHMVSQMPHAWKVGSPLKVHVHWKQNQGLLPDWKFTYRTYNNGELVPSSWAVVDLDRTVFNYASGSLAQINTPSGGLAIDMSGIDISGFIEMKLSRNGAGDTYVGDALATELDLHYQLDSLGSGAEFAK